MGKKIMMAKSILILLVLAAGITALFTYKGKATRNSLASRIASYSPVSPAPREIEELRKAIDLYEQKIDEHIRDAAQAGVYWKILGSKLIDKQMYGEALEALEHAVMYYPNDESIHYLIGMCAGNIAKSSYLAPERKTALLRSSEEAYLRAIEIDPNFGRALYGLAVLYVYELGRPAEAVPRLERLLELRSDTDAMFALAAAYYLTENYGTAVDVYDRIITSIKDNDIKAQAEKNRQQVMDVWYR